MPQLNLTPSEVKIFSELLERAANEFGNHGCNDVDVAKITGLPSDLTQAFCYTIRKEMLDLKIIDEEGSKNKSKSLEDHLMYHLLAARLRGAKDTLQECEDCDRDETEAELITLCEDCLEGWDGKGPTMTELKLALNDALNALDNVEILTDQPEKYYLEAVNGIESAKHSINEVLTRESKDDDNVKIIEVSG